MCGVEQGETLLSVPGYLSDAVLVHVYATLVDFRKWLFLCISMFYMYMYVCTCTPVSKHVHAHVCAGAHECQEPSTLGFIVCFYLDTRSLIGTPGLADWVRPLSRKPLGCPYLCCPQHWLGLQTCGPHAQLRTSCYPLSSMHHPCRAFSLLSLGLCTVCELCFCFFFLNVCVPGSGIIGFLGSFWRVVLTVVCQFICALLGFIIFAFLRQVFTLLHGLPWNSV